MNDRRIADDIRGLIAEHDKKSRDEREAIKKTRRFYGGDFRRTRGSDDRSDYGVTNNLTYTIVDTAVTSLVGSNPRVAVKGRNPDSSAVAPIVTGRLADIFDGNDVQEQIVVSIIDAVCAGRSVFKTRWQRNAAQPTFDVIDPLAVYFDQSCRLRRNIQYWLHCTPVRIAEFEHRLKNEYASRASEVRGISGGDYPKWLNEDGQSDRAINATDNRYLQWVTLWEFYDVAAKRVYHYEPESEAILLADEYDYPTPFDVYYLNHNGKDCRGLSEIHLILPQQETMNDLLTLLNVISHLQIPRMLYDSSRVDPEKLKEALETAVGSWIGVPIGTTDGPTSLASLFMPMSYPEHPEGVVAFLGILDDIASRVSALADASRGQIVNARTATEVAVLEAIMQTRLAVRSGFINRTLESLARKCFALDRELLQENQWVLTAGTEGFAEYEVGALRADSRVDFKFEMVAHNPVRSNPGVIVEAMQGLIPFLTESLAINRPAFDKFLLRAAGAPEDVLVPDTEIKKAAELLVQQAEQQGALPEGTAAKFNDDPGAAAPAEAPAGSPQGGTL